MSKLQPNNIYIWHIQGTDDPKILQDCSQLLSESEYKRAEKIKITSKRNIYICTHAAIRQILSEALDCEEKTLQFETEKNGKPFLKDHPHIQFNLSHSDKHALLAICLDTAIGIDLEKITKGRNLLGIAKRFFHADEYKWLKKQDKNELDQDFYRLWCYKEAYLKGLGTGLQGDLSKLPLSQDMLTQTSINIKETGWTIERLSVLDGFEAAIAYHAKNYPLTFYEWRIRK